ncbi:ABC transporter ATP-binding protein [Oligoflexus tunisiensis]|uniref:ABC transporter ATP-binding protein n=1 Tax=Oligoflexus tunisiensis TaxID=708132 RepID=UPI000B190FC6|nr:ABC transporter ATP-binding protein [Oligoflexus tunisiensis]
MLDSKDALLRVRDLRTSFQTENGTVRALDGISLAVEKGKTLAVVGESGCGKSVTAMTIMGLVQEANGFVESGEILFEGQDLTKIPKEKMRAIRGDRISMIFQEPMTALNPVYTVGNQIAEVVQIHRGASKREALQEALRMLKLVHIPDAAQRLHEYPFQLSGGMRQRVMIAMALACEPSLLIADEPTTALDVTIQAQILRLMKELQQEKNTSIIFITHDLGIVAEMADRVVVMYAGKAVEHADVFSIFENPRHPYTKGLLQSIPSATVTKKQKLFTIEGTVPSLRNLPQGCRFNTRCPFAFDRCFVEAPDLTVLPGDHRVACHLEGK